MRLYKVRDLYTVDRKTAWAFSEIRVEIKSYSNRTVNNNNNNGASTPSEP